MQLASTFWSFIHRTLDGTVLAPAHAQTFWDKLAALFSLATKAICLNTGITSVTADAEDAVLLAFVLPAGKTLNVWDYGWALKHADLSAKLYDATGTADLLALETDFATESTDPSTPLATLGPVTADTTVQLLATNANAGAARSGAIWLRVTVE